MTIFFHPRLGCRDAAKHLSSKALSFYIGIRRMSEIVIASAARTAVGVLVGHLQMFLLMI